MRSVGTAALLALLGASCTASSGRAPEPLGPPVVFRIRSGFGAEADWVPEHLTAAAEVLVRRMESPELEPPGPIEVTLVLDPPGEHGGWATENALGYVGDRFPEESPYVWILTHELCNVFAAHYGGHGGFPSDWWSNGRSPFPTYLTWLVLAEIGHEDTADWLRTSNAEEPDYQLYWALHERFGFGLFARTLRLLRADDLDLGEIQPPWPHPNARRSAYTVAYLSLAAGEDLTALVSAHRIGHEPSDWSRVHPDLPFEPYVLRSSETRGIQRARALAFGSSGTTEMRSLFAAGRWEEVLAERSFRDLPADDGGAPR